MAQSSFDIKPLAETKQGLREECAIYGGQLPIPKKEIRKSNLKKVQILKIGSFNIILTTEEDTVCNVEKMMQLL
ncbi:hypothetical protein K2173_023756 [Erythroxylum novogranatense]|uniref:Uncharacterized protein n=1 Tax=Erythroxylum novogranatense TaxID=1862640 RepID=A0AAV8TK24_9ROSI|nr:hypothetical protein K2173_023756 [Erythroxylum novogranatense]